MIPGGALKGNPTEAPASWDFTNQVDTVQLETRLDAPYSVNIWCVAAQGAVYVAGSRNSTWTQNVAADSRVRLRVGDNVYALNAVEASAESDLLAFEAAAKAKYDFKAEPEQREESILFRLSPR